MKELKLQKTKLTLMSSVKVLLRFWGLWKFDFDAFETEGACVSNTCQLQAGTNR